MRGQLEAVECWARRKTAPKVVRLNCVIARLSFLSLYISLFFSSSHRPCHFARLPAYILFLDRLSARPWWPILIFFFTVAQFRHRSRSRVSRMCLVHMCTFLFFPFLSVMQNWSVQHRSVDRKSWTVRYYVESRNKDVFSLSRSWNRLSLICELSKHRVTTTIDNKIVNFSQAQFPVQKDCSLISRKFIEWNVECIAIFFLERK